MKKYRSISWFAVLLCLVLVVTGCSKEMSSSFSDDDEIKPGDPVIFTTYVPVKAMTRYADEAEFNSDIATYSPTTESYAFTYVMYKYGVEAPIASGSQVYWPDNVNAYGFKATAGTNAVAIDQTIDAKLLLQDKLIGYGFEPLWNSGHPDNIEGLNYRTCKQWKDANADRGVAPEDQKKIPLYLKHLRSKITIILKEGDGVNHEDLALSTAGTNIDATIYSYSGGETTEVKPYASETTISTVTYTQYTAIVEPYAYQTYAKTIAEIKLSNQVFTFSASNDNNDFKYNLTAGKHLIIEATLARGDAQKVLLTAQIVPWDVISTNATVGDDGLVGSTTDINSRAGLLAFLSGENNKAGNIANITADIDLESGEDWTSQPLNCTMKMNNHTLTTTHRIFSTIGVGGKLIGGTISVGGDGTVDAAIAETNRGTIQSITVDRTSTAKATIAGLVVTNSGTISTCTSNLPVSGTSDVVGGIAKKSVYHSDNGSMPVIEGCIANARVEGSGDTVGGGIVGKAVGRVSGNTFNYGITLLQEADKFKNIVYGKPDAETHQLRAYSNSWPTTAANTIGNHSSNNSNTMAAANIFDATIDSQTELATLLNNVYNIGGSKYRVSDNFSVTGSWGYSGTTAYFTLNGNGKTITSNFNPLFQNASTACTNLTITYTNPTP